MLEHNTGEFCFKCFSVVEVKGTAERTHDVKRKIQPIRTKPESFASSKQSKIINGVLRLSICSLRRSEGDMITNLFLVWNPWRRVISNLNHTSQPANHRWGGRGQASFSKNEFCASSWVPYTYTLDRSINETLK